MVAILRLVVWRVVPGGLVKVVLGGAEAEGGAPGGREVGEAGHERVGVGRGAKIGELRGEVGYLAVLGGLDKGEYLEGLGVFNVEVCRVEKDLEDGLLVAGR